MKHVKDRKSNFCRKLTPLFGMIYESSVIATNAANGHLLSTSKTATFVNECLGLLIIIIKMMVYPKGCIGLFSTPHYSSLLECGAKWEAGMQ